MRFCGIFIQQSSSTASIRRSLGLGVRPSCWTRDAARPSSSHRTKSSRLGATISCAPFLELRGRSLHGTTCQSCMRKPSKSPGKGCSTSRPALQPSVIHLNGSHLQLQWYENRKVPKEGSNRFESEDLSHTAVYCCLQCSVEGIHFFVIPTCRTHDCFCATNPLVDART